MRKVQHIVDYLDKNKLYPDIRIVAGKPEPVTKVDGKEVLLFASNNYLGLATHPRVERAAREAIERYGVGSDGSRLLTGNIDVHQQFEKEIASFKGGSDAIVWPSGYAANVGTISAIMNPPKVGVTDFFSWRSVIISDELNHASIIDGAIMSRQKKAVYRHRDMNHLESLLKKYRWRRKMVVTDGVFSMDGDIAPLRDISFLCKKYNAISMVDEAHATGVIGKTGRGTLELYDLHAVEDIDLLLGTCSKALASTGGFVVARPDIVRYLRVASRSYMFSTAMLPAASAALIAALEVIRDEPHLRDTLQKNAQYLRAELHKRGFNTFTSETQIIPVLIGSDEAAIAFSRKLFDRGIHAPCVRWPAVPKGQSRIRITMMATHTKQHIDTLVTAFSDIRDELRHMM